ncbi:MAG: hypothetical protein HC888_11000 [Candidatus Competibacteraceae bacterium]|nr:hypothetical protein [Candidatus Competibacteraceae bacterium]
MRDLTARKLEDEELAERLRAAEAEAAARVKANILDLVSHELRTPLNGVIGCAEVLLLSDLTEDQKLLAENVRTSGLALGGSVESILSVAEIDRGTARCDAVPVRPRLLVNAILDPLRDQAAERGIALYASVDGEVPEEVVIPVNIVRQVLVNLVGNGVKFTPSGWVAVEVDAPPGARPMLRFTIADTGIGIAAADQDRLFTDFHQVDQGCGDATKGSVSASRFAAA